MRKRNSSSGYDWTDAAFLVAAFEGINNVKVLITIEGIGSKVGADLLLKATATERPRADTEAKLLACVNATCSAINRTTLEGALSQLMYQLDAALAKGEFVSTLEGT